MCKIPMKKVHFLIVLTIFFLFSGCQRKTGPLRICVDLEYTGITHGSAIYNAFDNFLVELKKETGITDIEIEYIPHETDLRKSAVSRIRTEILSGEGPDVFIINCAGGDNTDFGEALFPIPEKAMESGLFLPIDKHLESAQYMEWEKFTPVVMKAGGNDEGQQLIPLTYTFPVLCYSQAEQRPKLSVDMTWSKMLSDDDLLVAASILGDGLVDDVSGTYIDRNIEFILGNFADYKNETLSFTEEELFQRVQEILACRDKVLEVNSGADNLYFEEYMGLNFTQTYADSTGDVFQKNPLNMIPLYSEDGGISATILSFAAINRNTLREKDAFVVVDFLLGIDRQQHSPIFYTFLMSDEYGIPVHEDLFHPSFPVGEGRGFSMSLDNFMSFTNLRDQITHARFQGGIDLEFEDMFYKLEEKESEEIRAVVSETYEILDRLIGE